MRMNINGMHFNEIAWLMGRLEKLHLSTRLDIFGDKMILSAECPEREIERAIIEYDENEIEEIDLENICF